MLSHDYAQHICRLNNVHSHMHDHTVMLEFQIVTRFAGELACLFFASFLHGSIDEEWTFESVTVSYPAIKAAQT